SCWGGWTCAFESFLKHGVVRMGRELAFVLINPYTIAKSRTGGVIARYLARTELDFVAARMFGPSTELVQKSVDLLRKADSSKPAIKDLVVDYVLKSYAPNPETGLTRRVMLLLFEGEDAVRKICAVTGSATMKSGSGQTIRDTYGDYILTEGGEVQYFEPAVLVATTRESAASVLRIWAQYSASDGGMLNSAFDVPEGEDVERTLVLLKPDNFRFRSLRPGNIIDLLSRSGLRIVCVKKFHMTVAQAEDLYAPVLTSLEEKFAEIGVERAREALGKEFGFDIPLAAARALCAELGPCFARGQFETIVEFMSGKKPSECSAAEKRKPGGEECFALVYEGTDAVGTIRSILGSTDPSKAAPGSVRREFGSDIMVNAAHASDSPENAEREIGIIRADEDTVSPWVDRYYGAVMSRVSAWIRLGARGGRPPA
ncbi:nucleoside-diphosphate kinase, partial [Verrucomicrobiota bacterium]